MGRTRINGKGPALAIGLSTALLGGSTVLKADDLTELSIEELLNTTVYTASKFPQKSSDAPASVSIVTAQDIEDFGYNTLADVLASIRGLHGIYDRNYQYLGVRGVGRTSNYNNRFLLLIDGDRMNDAIYENAAIGNDSLVDLNLVDRVEIIRGPGSSVYGSNAFLGVINVITRKGRDIDGWQLNLEAGSRGTVKNQAIYGKRFGNGLELLMSGSHYQSDGDESLHFRDMDFQIPEKQFGIVKGLDTEQFNDFHAKASYRNFGVTLDYKERDKEVPTASFGSVTNQPNETRDRRYALGLSYDRSLSKNLDLSSALMFSRYDFKRKSFYDRINEDLPPFSLSIDESTATWWNFNTNLYARLGRHRLVTGLEYQDNSRQHLEKYDLAPAEIYLDHEGSSRTWAVYLEDEIRVNEKLLLNLGARYDRYSNFGSTVNPRLAAIYSLTGQTTLKFLYGTAFRAPSEYEIQPGVDRIGSPNLQPEEVETFEIILEKYFSPNTRLTVSAYSSELTNLIELIDDQEADQLVFRNSGRSSSDGLELEYEHRWDTGQNLRMSYSYQRAMNDYDGSQLRNSPKHLAKLNFSTPIFGEAIRLGVEAQYTSGQRTLQFGTTDEDFPDHVFRKSDSYSIVNLNLVSKRFDSGLQFKASVYDFLDERAEHPAGKEHDQNIIVQDGRSFRFELNYQLGK